MPLDLGELTTLLHATLGPGGAGERFALAEQVARLQSTDLPSLALRLRYPSYAPPTQPWEALVPARCARLGEEAANWPLLACATLHPSGYVRQAALRALGARPSAEVLRFVLARANDWVPEIRAEAYRIVRTCLVTDHVGEWVRVLDAVEALERGRRDAHADLVGAIYTLLGTQGAEQALIEGVRSPDQPTRRRCARFVVRHPTAHTIANLQSSDDPALRLLALRTLIASDKIEEEALQRALHDRALSVRRCAFVAAVARDAVDEREVRDEFVFDRSSTVRHLARGWLRRAQPDIDLAACYREAIRANDNRRIRTAILGLGEVGGPSDVGVLRPFVENAAAPLRRAALTALHQLGDATPSVLFVSALTDPAHPVVRVATDALRERMNPALLPALWQTIEGGAPNVAIRAARCFARLEGWLSLLQLCELLPRAPEACEAELRAWLRRHVQGIRERPSPDAVARIDAALRFARATIAPHIVDEIAFVVHTAS